MDEYLSSVVALVLIVDPWGNAPIYLSIVEGVEGRHRRHVLLLSTTTATGVLAVFAVGGLAIFSYFGISLADFLVAAGVILLATAIHAFIRPEEASLPRGEPGAVVPLAVPFLAGPGAISMTVYISETFGVAKALIAVAIAGAVTFATLSFAELLARLLGRIGLRVVEKVVMLLVAAIGASMLFRGASMWVTALQT